MGKALRRHSPDPARQRGSGKQAVLRTEDFSQQLQALLWSALCTYFVAHPEGTFICIYSSWLTCHSPSSNVSIQGTIIYRIIDSRAPYRHSCQVTSPPLLVTSRDESKLPGCPFLWIQSEGGEVFSSTCPLYFWFFLPQGSPPVHQIAFQTYIDSASVLPTTTNKCQGCSTASFLLITLSFHVLLASWSRVSRWPLVCRYPMEHMGLRSKCSWSSHQDSKRQPCQVPVPRSQSTAGPSYS